MKKVLKIIIIILIILILLILLGYVGYKIFNIPSVSIKEKTEITKYVENYLTKKYGKHKYKITDIRYEYHRSTWDEMFDYSNPTGYWVDFKSDIGTSSWVTIEGLSPDDYKIDSDYFIKSYYFSSQDANDIYDIMEDMKPKEKFKKNLLNELRNEFDTDIYEVEDITIILSIPEDYGRIPTLEELKTDINLYKEIGFKYGVSNTIKDTIEYEEILKTYITNKYNTDSQIYFYQKNTLVSIFLID